ncbi:MAG: hypothetical protein IM562_01905 [Chitinophagaceae bacterium]|jgi:hypothetical protein|nr:hypothetical protein [Chitinophagaceae bacterium]MCA6445890.1 hypothetical protein [Chitinophagaceae bacterium]
MNIFKSVICHDYTVIRAQRQPQFKTNGVHMIGVCWIANTLSLVGIGILYFLLAKRKNDVYDLLFEIHYWELAGRVGIIVLLSIIYLIAFAAYGGKATFFRIIHEFMELDQEAQIAVARKGGRYFYGSLLVFAVVAGILFYFVKLGGYQHI